MANVTDSLIHETYDVKQQLGDLPGVVQNLQKFNSKLQLRQHSSQVKELTYNETNNVMIWGHPTFGNWSNKINDILLWLKLDGDAIDYSGNNYTTTWNGAETYTTGKQFDLAADFITNRSIQLLDADVWSLDSRDETTICLWVKKGTDGTRMSFISKGTTSNYEWEIRSETNNTISVNIFTSAGNNYMGTTTTSTVLSSDGWQHILVTYNKNTPELKIYLNNVNEAIDLTSFGVYTNGSANLRVGERADGNNDLTGQIQDVRIYSRILTTDERTAVYNEGLGSIYNYSEISNWGTTETAFDQSDYAIVPNNNEFNEYFFNTTYIDLENSDNIGDGSLSFVDLGLPLTTSLSFGTEGLVLQSTVIAKLRTNINSVTPVIDCTGDFTIYVSNDSGVTYNVATNNTKYVFSSSATTDELLYAIVSNEPITINKITMKINK